MEKLYDYHGRELNIGDIVALVNSITTGTIEGVFYPDEIVIKWNLPTYKATRTKSTNCFLIEKYCPCPYIYLQINSTKYILKKQFTGESIYKDYGSTTCSEWKEEFNKFVKVYGFSDKIDYNKLSQTLQDNLKWLSWLEEKGYIEKAKEKKMVVLKDVKWIQGNAIYLDSTVGNDYNSLLKKPPMTMTLEWEE